MWRTLLFLLPTLLRRKKTWPLLAIAGIGYYLYGGGNITIPGLSGLTGSGNGWSMPDMNITSLWKEPRDILVDRVEDARDAQQDTVEEFKTALEKFKEVTAFKGGDLEEKYTTLNAAYERSQSAADNISSRVDKVQNAANTLLQEWKEELNQYHDASLRQRAEAQFDATRDKAARLIEAMRRAEGKAKPVLSAFKDQVLYLKHNLNMQAIASLDQESAVIEQDVGRLVQEMEASIAEANAFIETLVKES